MKLDAVVEFKKVEYTYYKDHAQPLFINLILCLNYIYSFT